MSLDSAESELLSSIGFDKDIGEVVKRITGRTFE
jgi:hypothetical protein